MYFWATYTIFSASIIPDSYRSISAFVSDRLSVSIRLLINQRDYFIGWQLQRSTSKSDTSRSIHVLQKAISSFEIWFLMSISTYKSEKNLRVLFAAKVFQSALKIEFTHLFIGRSHQQHQFNIFQTSHPEIKKEKGKFILKRTALHRYQDIILDMMDTLLYKYIYFYFYRYICFFTNLCLNTV